MSGTRIVVTGQDGDGKSRIVSDEVIAPIGMGAATLARLWSADEIPTFPVSGAPNPIDTFFPGPGGYRFFMMTLMPRGESGEAAASDVDREAKLGGGGEIYMEHDNPGMHTTDTVDLEVVLSGEASMEFDDGEVVHLKAGDCFVQNGTRHRWFNCGTEPAVVAVILIGGHPRPSRSLG